MSEETQTPITETPPVETAKPAEAPKADIAEGDKPEAGSKLEQAAEYVKRLDEHQKTTIPEMRALAQKFEQIRANQILDGRSTGNFQQQSPESKMDEEVEKVIKDIY